MGAGSRFIFGVPLALALFASLLLPSAPAQAMSAPVCGVLCEKDPVPPPRPAANCGSYCPPARPLPVDATLSGAVRDVLGNPIPGAAVYWTYGIVWTDSAGRFSITVWADEGQVKLTADHDLFLWDQIVIQNPLVAQALPQDYSLPRLLGVGLSPDAFNPSQPTTITIEAVSTAPRAGTTVIAELPDASPIELAYDAEMQDRPGWRRWTGSFVASAGTPDGFYAVRSCALDPGAASDCGLPAGPAGRISQVKADAFAADSVAPVVSATSPARFADVLELAGISATWSDPLSGIDPASLAMRIDGNPVQASVSEGTVSASGEGISPGIHLVELSARDLAGNASTDSFLFTLVTIAAGPATATLVEVTVPVNPPPGSIPPPSTVTFRSPKVQVEGFSETLNASTWVGYGEIERPFALGQAEVVFDNGTPARSTVSVAIPPASASHQVATLAPSAESLEVWIPAGETAIADIVVDVPLGYNTSNSTATLTSASAGLAAPIPYPGPFLANEYDGATAVTAAISVCLGFRDGSSQVCELGDPPGAYVHVSGVEEPPSLAMPIPIGADPEQEFVPPACPWTSGGGCLTRLVERHAALVFGCPERSFPDGQWRNLCTGEPGRTTTKDKGYLAAYINAFLYADADGGYPLWQQNHVDAEEADYCANGRAAAPANGRTSATVFRVATNAVALDQASNPLVGGTFRQVSTSPASLTVMLGERTQATEGSSDQVVQNPPEHTTCGVAGCSLDPSGQRYQIQNAYELVPRAKLKGTYQVYKGSTVDALGVVSSSPTADEAKKAASNLWEFREGQQLAGTAGDPEGVSGRVQLATGVEFQTVDPAGYEYVATLAFQFVADFSACVR